MKDVKNSVNIIDKMEYKISENNKLINKRVVLKEGVQGA